MRNEQFVKSYDWITKAKNLTPTQKLIINQILRFDDTELKCIQSYPSMADAIGLSLSPVKKNLAILRKLEIVIAVITPYKGHKLTINLERLRSFINEDIQKTEALAEPESETQLQLDISLSEIDNKTSGIDRSISHWTNLVIDSGLELQTRYIEDVLDVLEPDERTDSKFLEYYQYKMSPIQTIRPL